MNNKIKKVESLLEDYYSTEDEFVRTDIPIIIMQNYVDWMIETIKNQQAEIDTLSMAHDEMHRNLPKDKHTLIKTIHSLNTELNFTEEALEGFDKAYEKEKEQNKRYRKLLKKTHRLAGIKKEIDYDLWKMIDKELEEPK